MKILGPIILAAVSLLSICSTADARFLQVDPVGYQDDVDLYTYVKDDPTDKTDLSGRCADHYSNGSCKVNVSAATGAAGAAAGRQMEGVLNRYDSAVNALPDNGTHDIKNKNGTLSVL